MYVYAYVQVYEGLQYGSTPWAAVALVLGCGSPTAQDVCSNMRSQLCMCVHADELVCWVAKKMTICIVQM